MQFALPPKNGVHGLKAQSSRVSAYQKRRLRSLALLGCGVLVGIYIIYHLVKGSPDASPWSGAPAGTPEVVLVTVFDAKLSEVHKRRIRENREDYAQRHGYANFFVQPFDYALQSAPDSWSAIPAIRHAITTHRHSKYIFYLSPHAMIMDPALSIEVHIMGKTRMESLMLKDKPVVPPDSVIHTFSHLKGNQIDLALSQDEEGLCPESFILRNGEWAKYFLDTWFDPLYRSYNFQKAEAHALEHIVQWHPTILTRLALIPPRTFNSYVVDIQSRGGKSFMYEEGDFIARAPGCEKEETRNCEMEMLPFYEKWKASYGTKLDP